MSLRLKSFLSRRLVGRGKISEYGDKIKSLTQTAEELSPDGGLYVLLLDKSEMFLPSMKLVRDLIDFDSMYSNRALQTNPELGEEFSEIAKHIKAIESIVSKRRKKTYKRIKEEKKRREVAAND